MGIACTVLGIWCATTVHPIIIPSKPGMLGWLELYQYASAKSLWYAKFCQKEQSLSPVGYSTKEGPPTAATFVFSGWATDEQRQWVVSFLNKAEECAQSPGRPECTSDFPAMPCTPCKNDECVPVS